MRQTRMPSICASSTPNPTIRRVNTSMTTITQKLFSSIDSQRNRSTLHKLSRVSAMAESHDGPLPPDFGRGWVRQNPPHHVLVNFQPEGVRNLLGNAGAAKTRIEAFDLEDCGNQFL